MSSTTTDAHTNADGVDGIAGVDAVAKTRLTRRTLTRGTAWSAPLAMVAVTAPAFAASAPCASGYAALVSQDCEDCRDCKGSEHKSSGGDDDCKGSKHHTSKGDDDDHDDDKCDDDHQDDCQDCDDCGDSRPSTLTFPTSAVTASVSYSSTPGDTGLVRRTDYSPSWSYLKLHHPEGMEQGDLITMTLRFSATVKNLTLTLTDIDQNTGQWIDEVEVAPTGFTSVKAANVVGSGIAGDPFHSRVDSGITSSAGDVKLTWPGPLDRVVITYRAADEDNGSDIGQHIGVGKIAFTC